MWHTSCLKIYAIAIREASIMNNRMSFRNGPSDYLRILRFGGGRVITNFNEANE